MPSTTDTSAIMNIELTCDSRGGLGCLTNNSPHEGHQAVVWLKQKTKVKAKDKVTMSICPFPDNKTCVACEVSCLTFFVRLGMRLASEVPTVINSCACPLTIGGQNDAKLSQLHAALPGHG